MATVTGGVVHELRKIIGKDKNNIGIIMAIFGPLRVDMYLNNTFKSFLELIYFRLVQYNADFIILKAQTLNSMISQFLNPFPSPKTNIIYLWRHQHT